MGRVFPQVPVRGARTSELPKKLVQVSYCDCRHLERKGEIINAPKLELSEAVADLRVIGEIHVTTTMIMRNGDALVKNGKKE